VAAQVGSGLPLDALFERQVDPALQSREISVELDMEKFGAEFTELLAGMNSAESPQEAQRRIRRGALIHHDLFGDAVAAGYVDAGFTPLPIPSGTARPDVRFVRRIGLWIRRG